ncbi:MAG TPA: tetratricopeptide repeat protein, partial [Burkholderiaceae bacterium]
LESPSLRNKPAQQLPVQLRRLQARVRLGQGARETEQECRELLATAERVGSLADVVQTRSLLVQTLGRTGELEEAIRIAEESLRIAEESGDDALAGDAMHRLAITLLGTRPAEAAALLLQLVERAQARGDRVMEARAWLTLGVARMRTRDDQGGADAFRAAQTIASESQSLDVKANASMNLGVIEMRSGDFDAARGNLDTALRLYTTLRNNANRLAALYNLANLERERGDADEASRLYRETSALADTLGAEDIAVGAHSGGGLAALRLDAVPVANASLEAAQRVLGARADWWFQGRELLESLYIRLEVSAGRPESAAARFHVALEKLEAMDVYAAAWLVADCAATLAEKDPTVWDEVHRFGEHAEVQQFVPLSARFTALRDMMERLPGRRFER